MYLNSVMIIGNLTRNPELKSLPNGTKVANFSLATNRTWKNDAGQKQEEVEYHNIVVFGRQAETSAQYLKKGSQAMIQGRNKTRSWDDSGTGKKMYRTEVIADNVQFGSKRTEDKVITKKEPTGEIVEEDTIEYPEEDINPEDIPF